MGKFSYIFATAAALTLGYAVYFDYNRRTNPEFRKQLKKSKKHHEKKVIEHEKEVKSVKLDTVRKALEESLKNDSPVPTDPSEKERFFMTEVTQGEQLSAQPGSELESAIHFYRALSIYPNPTDILSIYQRSVPQDIYDYVIMMVALQPPQSVASMLSESVQLDQEQD
ncbi:Mitochondrial import receptor subunit TOM20 [Wickerhamomyces ciferrii]|uniref:Mitochondrial import receptor subunit TOM20 n=1 Tax=Wickerhamomyces ciferrii (strain ATCC 14091 / BCRC 22168 / CBS 111 / JCM 3599 / NBRC 0793 / NRRL Y-1031 F-60-10) TaxID=1206466 RepID=K0KTL1_WICCF|nr:Mitochondrial import receptor subunit TOM20 [Wickerhamomyces ciferrii]CCH45357.1 Mitochondrial import receptor subunit TOM20 [Wickerhamomyces ciferrii]